MIGKGHRELLGKLVLAAGGATLLQAVTSFALSQLLGKAAQRSITELRRRVQRHVGRLSVSYFDQTKVGALLSRVMTDAEGIRNLVGTGLVEVLGGLITAIFALAILFYLNTKLTLIALSVLSLFSVVLLYAFKTLRPLFRERSKINAEVSGRLTESFSGIRVVKAYRAERREALVFSKGAHRLFRNVARTMTGFSAVTAFSTLLLGVVGVAILWIGANDVLAHRMTIGSFFSFTLYLGLLVGPVVQMVSIGSQITEAFAGLERIREIRNEIADDAGDEAAGAPAAAGGPRRVSGRPLRVPGRRSGDPGRLVRRQARHLDRAGGLLGIGKEHVDRAGGRLLPARPPARSSWTATTWRACAFPTTVRSWGSSCRTTSSSTERSSRTSPTPGPTPSPRRCGGPRRSRAATTSSRSCPRATTPSSASAGSSSPADNASGSRSPGRFWPTRAS